MNLAKKSAIDWVMAQHRRLSDDHLTIWNYHEPSWREYKSARWYVERLRAEGFEVEAGSGKMPTAFCARWSSGSTRWRLRLRRRAGCRRCR